MTREETGAREVVLLGQRECGFRKLFVCVCEVMSYACVCLCILLNGLYAIYIYICWECVGVFV